MQFRHVQHLLVLNYLQKNVMKVLDDLLHRVKELLSSCLGKTALKNKKV